MVLVLFKVGNREKILKKMIDIIEDMLGIKIDEKNKFFHNLKEDSEYSVEKGIFKITLLTPKVFSGKNFHMVNINFHHNHIKEEREINLLIELSIRICKELDVVQLVDNHFIDKDDRFGRMHINYMNQPLTEIEKKQKQHYINYFENIIAFKKLLINGNPFLVFIENSAKGKASKNWISKHEQGFFLNIKFLTSIEEYDKQSMFISQFMI
jgi:hypothetical protein